MPDRHRRAPIARLLPPSILLAAVFVALLSSAASLGSDQAPHAHDRAVTRPTHAIVPVDSADLAPRCGTDVCEDEEQEPGDIAGAACMSSTISIAPRKEIGRPSVASRPASSHYPLRC